MLKPCPFCGSDLLTVEEGAPYVLCTSCYAGGLVGDETDEDGIETPESIVAVWNRRDGGASD